MRILLTLSYDGTGFCGWQRQKNGLSVQQVTEDGIFALTGERVTVTGSGRTDAGVHAEGQTAHFDTESGIPAEKFFKALNTCLPDSVKATASRAVDGGFNARSSAKRKTYRYDCYVSDVQLPLKERYAARVYGGIDTEKMRSCAKLLIGEHDFKAFSATGGSVKTTVRTVYDLQVSRKDDRISVTVTGSGFLYNMVRIIAGTLIRVGKGEITEETVLSALATGERTLLGETMPPNGLCLVSVEYV